MRLVKSLGIVGFGSFGQFMAGHLTPTYRVSAYDVRDVSEAARQLGVRWASLEEVSAQEILVLAVPVQNMQEVLEQVAGCTRLPELVVDVASVKVKPMELMQRFLPESVEIIGTHPMFGPQSGRDGISNLKVVLCAQSSARVDRLEVFLRERLDLKVMRMSPEAHDSEMAYVQGLTHWIAKALREIKLPDLDLSTPAYRYLIRIEEILREDSDALFRTIQAENPFAAEARAELMKKLREIEESIS